MNFGPGDMVFLKSGGPRMTVESVGEVHMTGEAGVWCVWFEQAGSKQVAKREVFAPVTLKRAEERKQPARTAGSYF
ncbi:MAG: DUF2158 domain-containing protein [Mesorhizobium sp.]|uniref:YodC family protein n=1 Tax=Mesorhizobium sp. TaxID=1871066 RepID=UPI000FEA8849|nr:DUF2158 domain-containing protein [Mesorhizobium sp.]RWI50093.1 MAG: DUF2158 domain-containing protein [Mesorhizobium sp.]